MVKANFNGVDPAASGFAPMPPGRYEAICTGYEEKVDKNTSIYIRLEWTVRSGAFANRKVWDRLSLDHANQWGIGRTKLICKRLGLGAKKNLDADIDLDQPDFIGLAATLTLTVDEYDAADGSGKKKTNKVTFNGYNEGAASNSNDAGVGSQASLPETRSAGAAPAAAGQRPDPDAPPF